MGEFSFTLLGNGLGEEGGGDIEIVSGALLSLGEGEGVLKITSGSGVSVGGGLGGDGWVGCREGEFVVELLTSLLLFVLL